MAIRESRGKYTDKAMLIKTREETYERGANTRQTMEEGGKALRGYKRKGNRKGSINSKCMEGICAQ